MPPFLEAVLVVAALEGVLCVEAVAGFLPLDLAVDFGALLAAVFGALLEAVLAAAVLLVLFLAALLVFDAATAFLSTVTGRAPAANRQPRAMSAMLCKILRLP